MPAPQRMLVIPFLAGFVVCGGLIVAYNSDAVDAYYEFRDFLHCLMSLLIAPALAAAVTLAQLQGRRPRRAFEPGNRRWFVLFRAGFSCGVLSLCLLAVGVHFLDRAVPDTVLSMLCAVAATTMDFFVHPRLKLGHCLRCDYDLCASLAFGRCPECGTAL